jgi:hypothetical protein
MDGAALAISLLSLISLGAGVAFVARWRRGGVVARRLSQGGAEVEPWTLEKR